MSRRLLILALLLPLGVIALGVVRAEYHLAHSRTWAFDVSGYDPRDLLRGHYIQFRIDLHEGAAVEPCNDEQDGDCCYCLTATGGDEPPLVQRATCSHALEQCDGALRTQDVEELTRFYIPEEDAPELEQRFQAAAGEGRSRLHVAIDDAGKPQIRTLLVDGEELRREETE